MIREGYCWDLLFRKTLHRCRLLRLQVRVVSVRFEGQPLLSAPVMPLCCIMLLVPMTLVMLPPFTVTLILCWALLIACKQCQLCNDQPHVVFQCNFLGFHLVTS